MAANVDSPKRRSLRLQRGSDDYETPEGHRSRTSGPRTRLSGGTRSDPGSGGGSAGCKPQRRSKGQKTEDSNSRTAAKAAQKEPTEVQVPGGASDTPGEISAAPNGRTMRTRRSREGPQDNVSHVKSDRGDLGSSQGSLEEGQDNVVKSDTNKTGPSVERTRTDIEEAGPSGVHNFDKTRTSRDNENLNASVLSPSKRPQSPLRNAHQGSSAAASGSAPSRDSRVQCTSKQLIQEVLGMCAEFSKEILESQKYLTPEQRQLEHKNFTWNFETTFQDNLSLNGQSWHEAPDTASEPDIKILEDELDDAIVETAMKRKRHPRKILGHFVKALKVEREILDQYKPVVEPTKHKLDSAYESRMVEQTVTTTSISQQIKETMKALPAQLEKAEGFSQVLNLQPLLQGSRIRQDIFSSQVVLKDMAKTVPKELETTPGENEPVANIAPVRNIKKRQSPSVQNTLYPLRSKRKISLDG